MNAIGWSEASRTRLSFQLGGANLFDPRTTFRDQELQIAKITANLHGQINIGKLTKAEADETNPGGSFLSEILSLSLAIRHSNQLMSPSAMATSLLVPLTLLSPKRIAI